MLDAASQAGAAVTPFFMKRSDGMSAEYIEAATKLSTMFFQTLSNLQTHVLDAPAFQQWADVENRRLTLEQAHYIDGATELAELVMPELGQDAEALRLEAESSLEAGRKLRMTTVPITSWNDGLVFRMFYGRVLHGQLAGVVGSNLIPLANVAQKLYFAFCMRDWPAQIGSPHVELIRRAIAEGEKQEIQAAVDKWWPLAADSFGEPGSKNETLYMRLGLKTRPNAMCKKLFVKGISADLADLGLRMP